jgi:hypothetical protein
MKAAVRAGTPGDVEFFAEAHKTFGMRGSSFIRAKGARPRRRDVVQRRSPPAEPGGHIPVKTSPPGREGCRRRSTKTSDMRTQVLPKTTEVGLHDAEH